MLFAIDNSFILLNQEKSKIRWEVKTAVENPYWNWDIAKHQRENMLSYQIPVTNDKKYIYMYI